MCCVCGLCKEGCTCVSNTCKSIYNCFARVLCCCCPCCKQFFYDSIIYFYLKYSYGDQLNDIFTEYSKEFRESDPVKKAEIEKKIDLEIWPNTLKVFEEAIAKNNGWLVGHSMTYADMYLTVVLERLGNKRDATLAKYPNCKALAEKVSGNPKIAEWIKRRPTTYM